MASLPNPETPPPPSAANRTNPKSVERAVKALLKWRNDNPQTESEKPKILEEGDEFVYLVLTLKKIPPKGRSNPHKIPLPHPLHAADSSNLCLIIDDRPRSNLSKDGARKKIKAENIPISEVIKVSELRSDYRPFDAKRKLFDSFDMFFSDKRIVPLLPKLLGKQFYKRRKIPVPVDLKQHNWKEQIETACGSAMLYLKSGTCSVLRVARTSMGREEIVENVMAAIAGMAEVVPRKWSNVRSLHVKLLESLALPVYQGVSDGNLKIEASKGGEDIAEKNQKVQKKRTLKKGLVREVKDLNSKIGEVLDEDECSEKGKKMSSVGKLNNVELKNKKRKKSLPQ